MFTGIIEAQSDLLRREDQGSNVLFTFASALAKELKIDQSLNHDGVCLTIVGVRDDEYEVVAVEETLKKSTLGLLKPGDKVNLERSMPANGRFDGHIVQGHVDQTAVCDEKTEANGSYIYAFRYDTSLGNMTVEKGSISVNGVSLTVYDSGPGRFKVAIIPYTYENSNFSSLRRGSVVNLEFDILGKYIAQMLRSYQ